MNKRLTVSDIANVNAPILSKQTPLLAAIDTFLEHQVNGAAVCDQSEQLVGFLSVHDVLVEMWCQDYIPDQAVTVGDVMTTELVTVQSSDLLTDVMEFITIDKEQLYPTTSMGYATAMTTLNLEQRAKSIKVHRPQILPVLNKGKYVGTVTRQQILASLRRLFVEPTPINSIERTENEFEAIVA